MDQVSIAIPQMTGGGAEKIFVRLAGLLARDGRLSRIYSGSRDGAAAFSDLDCVHLDAPRALGAVRRFVGEAGGDPARIFLLTLGYINFAPLIRLRLPRRKIVLRLGNTIGPEVRGLGWRARWRYLLATQLACSSAHRIIVQCEYMKDDLLNQLWVNEHRISVIYNFVENEIWTHVPESRPPFDFPYIFVAATFKPQKAFDSLLAAYAQVRSRTDRKLVIAGVAPDDPGFLEMLSASGLPRKDIHCLGFLENIYDLIVHADICALCSRYEGLSNFLLEAAAFGKRIVATDCPGGNAELFRHYTNAEVVPVDAIAELADALAVPRHDIDREKARQMMQPFWQEEVYKAYLGAIFPTE